MFSSRGPIAFRPSGQAADTTPNGLPRRLRPPFGARSAFTMIEIVVVLLVISILMLMLVESYKNFQARADRLRCTTNLRSLHIALAAYTHDHEQWPQCPVTVGDPQFDTWWIKELAPYHLGRSSWECPTLKQLQAKGEASKPKSVMLHYIPTQFDSNARTPFKWPIMPWAVEIGDFHGDGNLILFQDGSVRGFNQFSATSASQP